MTSVTISLLRAVLVVMFVGVFLAQILIPFAAWEVTDAHPEVRYLLVPYSAAAILALVCVETVLVAVWKLLSMVRRGEIFSARAFRWVDVIIGCAFAAAAFSAAVVAHMLVASIGNLVAILGVVGAIATGVGVGLLMIVMRGLLTNAIENHDELAEVI